MDLDAYAAARGRQWGRLEELVRRRRLTGAEGDELLDLYQRVSTDLSVVRSASPDPSVVSYLSLLLTRARLEMVGTRTSTWTDALRFFTRTFPAALYRTRWWWVATALTSVLVAVLIAAWTLRHPEVYTSQLSPAEIRAYVGTDFQHYYSEFPHHEFATEVWVNNAWVAAQCIAGGVLGLPVLYVVFQNVMNLGVVAALMISHDRTSLFFGLILPHGLLELTAVFVAGAIGLRLCWSWVEPGPRTRLQSLAAEGRTAVAVALGLVFVLLVSGAIEGFVTPSGLPTWARIGVGLVAESGFLAYVFVVGRAAHRAGVTGDVEARDAGDAPLLVG
ncbi:stage II sporulation protein M [Nostocoides sp. HKS02]|uniref:stage II sporulation protein M n=1 Tax=Nostocoides sp. HKS02 TaxID=1813880 RepID=UPI0012B4D39C|nr:stage II sporulation protein M [Tetrasphaera sp. HKS02]QGN56613.1 stage II sporulation protein M [Tetrasphaera sp. HKS02]